MKEAYKYTRYPSGLRLITVPMQSTQTVTVLVLVKTGSRYETKDINGISHFLEHLMFKGTQRRPGAFDISEELDSIGADYNAFTSKEYTGYYVKCASEKLDIALDVISDIFQNSKFDAGEIDRERGPVKEEINMWFDNPARYVSTLYDSLLFGDQPLGWDIAGTKENIDKMTREDFVSYFNKHYVAQNTVISVAGNIDPESIEEKIPKYFNSVRENGITSPIAVIENQKSPALKVFYKETEQTNINFGFRAYSRFHPKYEALELISCILGGGMSSRLFVEVREKRGLAYRIGAGASAYAETGEMTTSAGLSNTKLSEALRVIAGEHKKLIEVPVSDRELAKSKDFIKGKFAIGLEPSDSQASYYAEQELLEDKIQSPAERLKKFDAVTASDIQEVAREIFQKDRLNLAIVGPVREEKDILEILNDY